MTWIYRPLEGPGYEVGYYDPGGNFCPEPMLPATQDAAAARVAYLNGGGEIRLLRRLAGLIEKATELLREEARLLRQIREELGG